MYSNYNVPDRVSKCRCSNNLINIGMDPTYTETSSFMRSMTSFADAPAERNERERRVLGMLSLLAVATLGDERRTLRLAAVANLTP
mmetsp:Transcript_2553/g.5931  ORF Transcript_2553/g.5931 Transcript_2553/m.5931 type:complete len:86 (-) Transcript_2553:713-970(-)